MISPCRRHMLRQSAIIAAQQAAGQLTHATGYELQMQKLNADKQALHKIQSFQDKAALKRKLLPEYAPWVSGVLAEGNGAQDAILMTVMIWRIDAGDIAGALNIARYAFKHRLAMPFGTRTAGCAFTEEVIDQAVRARTAGEPVSVELMLEVLELTDAEDMPDKVRAQLHKIIGYLYRDGGKDTLALERLKSALILDSKSGVKKDIERLESTIKKHPAAKKNAPRAGRHASRDGSLTSFNAGVHRPPFRGHYVSCCTCTETGRRDGTRD